MASSPRSSHSQPSHPLYYKDAVAGGAVSFEQVAQYQSGLSIGWSQLTAVPTTIAGYGITDAYTSAQVDALLAGKANVATTLAGYGITDAYTKTATDALLAAKANSATTLAGYGITDAYTSTQVDTLLGALTAADIAAGSFPSGDYNFPREVVLTGASGAARIYDRTSGSSKAWVLYADTGLFKIFSAESGSDVLKFAPFGGMQFSGGSSPYFQLNDGTRQAEFQIVSAQAVIRHNAIDRFTMPTGSSITANVRLDTTASTAGGSGLRIPHGAAPTAPVNGDMWTTTAGLFIRINGATVGPLS